jgi:F-type H+-transporting ATPase subunit epsilon
MFKLTLLTPDKKIFVDHEIEDVRVPAFRGELDVLPGHAPLITTLSTGILRWRLKGEADYKTVVVSWGYCEIHPDGVDILADIVDLPEEINLEADKTIIQDNEKKLLNEMLDDEHWDEAQREIARARAHLDVVRGE